LAHVSDLHFGRSGDNDARATRISRALYDARVDHVVVTGDLTHRGRRRELERFHDAFAPLREAGRLTIIPGNHDRLGDDVGDDIMPGERVQVTATPNLYLVRINSTGPHNRTWIAGHGLLQPEDIDAVETAVARAPEDRLVVLLLHHHLLPLPEEHAVERLSSFIGLRFTSELPRGRELLERIQGRCDLVLHGHRHVPCERRLFDGARPLRVFNAGSSTELGRACVFTHAAGRLVSEPVWLDALATRPEESLWRERAHHARQNANQSRIHERDDGRQQLAL
jgi:Icc protein